MANKTYPTISLTMNITKNLNILSSIFFTFFLLFASGCSAPQVKLNFSTTANLNMNSKNEPLPVVVHIYQLSDPKAFESATFSDLWKSDLTVLGNSLLRKDTLTLDPAAMQTVILDRHEQTQFIGLMAAFNNQTDDSWRLLKKTRTSFWGLKISNKLQVILQNNSIDIVD